MRILFVDDEQMILGGLGRLLWRQQTRWDMTFVPSGAAALDALAASTFDLVVSDLRMSGMDGAVLFRTIKERHPGVVRIVLSGQADFDLVMRSLPVAHQYLQKPCSAASLIAVLERVAELRARVTDERVRALVGGIDAVTVSSQQRRDLVDALDRPRVELDDVVEVVERAPAVCAKLLQLAGSSFFGLAQRVVSVRDAVAALGVDLVRTLIVDGTIFGSAEPRTCGVEAQLARVASHTRVTARLVRSFMTTPEERSVAFVAGLVHELGRDVFAAQAPSAGEVAQLADDRVCRPVHLLEQARFGVTHAEVGAYLLGLWGLPAEIVEPVRYHHDPRRCPAERARVTAALHVADALLEARLDAAKATAAMDTAWLEAVGLGADVGQWTRLAVDVLAACQA